MSHVINRAVEVQRLLAADPVCLGIYEAPYLACPLKFDLVPSALELKNGELDACLALVERTSGEDYRASSIGWNPTKKRLEMADKDMIYLLVREGVESATTEDPNNTAREKDTAFEEQNTSMEKTGAPELNALEQLICDYPSNGEEDDAVVPETATKAKDIDCALRRHKVLPSSQDVAEPKLLHPSNTGRILGFVSFMFTYDDPPYDNREVLYLYEIHLHEGLRGCGLGSRLIKFFEHAGRHCGIDKTMLTVFSANEGARALYEKLGYTKDRCSPKDRITRHKVIKADYLIMSKNFALRGLPI